MIKALQVAYDLAFDPRKFVSAYVDPNPRKSGYIIEILLIENLKHEIKASSKKEAYDKITWLVDAINRAVSPSNPIVTPGPFDTEILMARPSLEPIPVEQFIERGIRNGETVVLTTEETIDLR